MSGDFSWWEEEREPEGLERRVMLALRLGYGCADSAISRIRPARNQVGRMVEREKTDMRRASRRRMASDGVKERIQ